MKKMILGGMLFLAITIVSCGDIEIVSKTILSEKNGADFTFKVAYNQSVGKTIKNNFMEGQLEVNNMVVNKYMDGTSTVEEVNIKEESLSQLASNEELKKILNYRVSKKDYFYKSVYIVEIRPGAAVFNIEKKYEDEQVKEAIRNIPYTNIVTFDGTLIGTNAKEVISPNEIRWNYKIGLLNKNTVMTLEYKVNTLWKVIALLLGIIIVVIIIIILSKLKKSRKNNKIDKTEGY